MASKATHNDVLKQDYRWRHVDLADYGLVYKHIVPTTLDLETCELKRVVLSSQKNLVIKTWPNSPYALNQMFATDHTLINVDANLILNQPIVLTSSAKRQGSMVNSTKISVSEHANVSFINEVDTVNAMFINRSTEISVGLGSTVTYFLHIKASVDRFETLNIFCAEGSRINVVTCITGSCIGHVDLNVHLLGPEAHANVGVIGLPSGSGQVVQHTLQHHQARGTTSDLDARSVLVDRTKSLYNGLIKIDQQANGSNAYQKNSNVLLSNTAKAFSVPNLEIKANDVRCTHGSTTSGLSADELFYASSRGIAKARAKQLVTAAFLDPVVARLQNPHIEKLLRKLIRKTIKKTFSHEN